MPSNVESILFTIATVAATFAGFSGVVAVFGRRAHGHWYVEERFRLTNMLLVSTGACLMSFVPAIENLFHLPEQTLWKTASSILGILCASYFFYAITRWRHVARARPGRLPVWAMITFAFCLGCAAILQILNATSMLGCCEAGPYVAGLWWLLLAAGHQFAFLVLDSDKSDPTA